MGERQRSSLAVVLAALLFGTTGTALQRFEPGAAANGVSALRLLVGSGALCAVAIIDRPTAARPWRTVRVQVALGGLAVAAYQVCFFIGTTRTGVALATVVTIGSGPVFSGVIDACLYRRAPARPWLLGTAVSVVGVVLLGTRDARVDALGLLAALGSGLGWAIYATIGKRQIERGLDSTACMAGMFSVAAIVVSPFLFTEDIGWVVSPHGALLALYLGVFTVGAAYTSYGRGLRHLTAPTVITLTLAEPITAAVLSSAILHESIDAVGWLGIALVLAGLVVTARGPRVAAGVEATTTLPT